MFSSLSHQQVWDMLPLSTGQRDLIINDFIETGKYDKIEDEKKDLCVEAYEAKTNTELPLNPPKLVRS
jgi:hypothetical protein